MTDGFKVVAAIVAFVGFGGMITLAGFIWKLADRLRSLESNASAAQAKAESAAVQASTLHRELSDFKIDAARRFVTDEMLAKVEERVITAIDRLGDRLDRAFEHQDQRRPRA